MTENWIAEMNEEDEEGIHSSFRGERERAINYHHISLSHDNHVYILG